MRIRFTAAALVVVLSASAVPPWVQTPLGTVFVYQGQLKDGGSPADGLHVLHFRLFDAALGGTQVGTTVCAFRVFFARLSNRPENSRLFKG